MMFVNRSLTRRFLRSAILVSLLLTITIMSPAIAQQPSSTNAVNTKAVAYVARNNQTYRILESARQQGYLVPEEVDRNDPSQRLLLLTTGGPLLMEMRLKLDGRPFSIPREEMIDSLVQSANPAPDEVVSWEAVFRHQRLAGGRFNRIREMPELLKSTVETYDINGNGLAERYELRMFLALSYGGASFGIMPSTFQAGSTSKALFKILDQDSDGLLSHQELAGIQDSLKQRDVNDNEMIESIEISPPQSNTGRPESSTGILLAIGPGTDLNSIRQTVLARYGCEETLSEKMIPQSTALVKHLDRNSNGLIDEDEWNHLSNAPPQISLDVNLGSGEGIASGMTVISLAEELGPKEKVVTFQNEQKLIMVLDTCHLELFYTDMVPRANYEQSAQTMLNLLDQDKNGYLELSEVEQMGQSYAGQFETWDANQDGKVYLEEIRSAYEESQRPASDRVLVGGIDQGRAIFKHLDVSGEDSLSLRELQQAEQKLRKLDRNENGQVESNELPVTLRIGIGRGYSAYQLLRMGTAVRAGGMVLTGGAQSGDNPSPPAEPRWFSGMDRNGDNDLSPREFLGTPAQFADLDADGDGLVSREEALAKTQ